MYKIKRFLNKIIKICKYLLILWKDEDWDYEYILALLKYKLERTRDCISRNQIISNNERRAICIQINQALDHLNNYRNADEIYDDLRSPLPFEIDHVTMPAENDCWKMVMINKEANRRLTSEEDEIYGTYLLNKHKFEQEEWEAVWDTIKEHGQGWWE